MWAGVREKKKNATKGGRRKGAGQGYREQGLPPLPRVLTDAAGTVHTQPAGPEGDRNKIPRDLRQPRRGDRKQGLPLR